MNALRISARIAMVVGAGGSVALMLWAGKLNPSSFLMFLFAGWVTLPFVGLAAADRVSQRWSASARTTLHVMALVFAKASLAVYGVVVFGPPRPRTAFWFLMLPLASLVVLTIAVVRAELAARGLEPTDTR